jgi:hypothetical protein
MGREGKERRGGRDKVCGCNLACFSCSPTSTDEQIYNEKYEKGLTIGPSLIYLWLSVLISRLDA